MSDKEDPNPEEEEEVEEGEEEKEKDDKEGNDEPKGEPEPDRKPWSGSFILHIGGGVEATVTVPTAPAWLLNVLVDDVYYFKKELAAMNAEGAVVPPGEGFDPNQKYILTPTGDDAYELSVFIPPEPTKEADKPPETNKDDDEGDGTGEGGEGGDGEGGEAEGGEVPEEEDDGVINIDVFTLCVMSCEAATIECLEKAPSLTEFENWLLYTMGPKCRNTAERFAAAVKSFGKKITMDFNWIFQKSATVNNQTFTTFAQEIIPLFITSGILPSAVPTSEFMKQHRDVVLYAHFLMNVPRSLLISWCTPPSEDTPAALPPFLGNILLELRKYFARSKSTDKPPYRTPITETLKNFLPQQLESGPDVLLTTEFGPRPYPPLLTQLYASDLLLLLLCLYPPELSLETFTVLLNKKNNIIRDIGSTVGTYELLYGLCTTYNHAFVHVLFSLTSFAIQRDGFVNLVPFIPLLAKLSPNLIQEFVVRNFQKLSEDTTLTLPADIEKQCKKYLVEVSAIHDAIKLKRSDAVTLIEKAVENAWDLDLRFLMYSALECSNIQVIEYLIDRHHTHTFVTFLTAPEKDILSYAIEKKYVEVVLTLIRRGASLKIIWGKGLYCGYQYIQDNYEHTVANEILSAWKAEDERRCANPDMKFGLLCNSL
eukprot:PhF_6_TR30370/c0_g1_i1/m.44486